MELIRELKIDNNVYTTIVRSDDNIAYCQMSVTIDPEHSEGKEKLIEEMYKTCEQSIRKHPEKFAVGAALKERTTEYPPQNIV